MLMEVTCRCGYVMRGSKSELIEKVREHGRSAHQLEVTPAQVRALWRMVDDPPANAAKS
ncbi:MAG: DUF1059 domain-containing protein [Chloroflexi bacterium]|nr:MAG: DUF1059 domain-containing protein [Chloroflexota bacterium]